MNEMALDNDSRYSVGKRKVCNVCSRSFTRTAHLERHVRSHTNEKPFRCHACGRSYARQDTLARHQKEHNEAGLRTTSPAAFGRQDSRTRASTRNSDLGATIHATGGVNPASPQSAGTEALVSNEGLLWDHLTGSAASMPGTITTEPGSCHLPDNNPLQLATLTVVPTAITTKTLLPDQDDHAHWEFAFDHPPPDWMIDTAFDMNSFELPLVSTMAETGQAISQAHSPVWVTSRDSSQLVHMLWFTRLEDIRGNGIGESGTATPITSQRRDTIDDTFRQTLQRKLQITAFDPPLPSSNFLNLCVRAYFTRFHSVYPIVHAPTFRPSRANSLLLLSICSVGSLFTGSVNAAIRGARIFEWLNKAILATWDRLLARHVDEVLCMVQAALIGQTFGLLSGDPKHLATVDAFHGTVISWGRRKGLFDVRHDPSVKYGSSHQNIETIWHDWARKEESIRAVLGLYIHDAELASIYHHEPYLRHTEIKPQSSPANVFMASKAAAWAVHHQQITRNTPQRSPNNSLDVEVETGISPMMTQCHFATCARLESVSVMISKKRLRNKLDSVRQDRFSEELIDLYRYCFGSLSHHPPDDLGLIILWHLCFISIFANFDLLERAIGRDGCDVAAASQEQLKEWANTIAAKRCVIHILLLQKRLEALPLGSEPAIHVPRAIFLAAMTWYCYAQHVGDIRECLNSARVDFPEFRLLEIDGNTLLYKAHGYQYGKPSAVEANEVLCRFRDMLQKVGHWEMARKFALIITALINEDVGQA